MCDGGGRGCGACWGDGGFGDEFCVGEELVYADGAGRGVVGGWGGSGERGGREGDGLQRFAGRGEGADCGLDLLVEGGGGGAQGEDTAVVGVVSGY